jgi:hypothetical protein
VGIGVERTSCKVISRVCAKPASKVGDGTLAQPPSLSGTLTAPLSGTGFHHRWGRCGSTPCGSSRSLINLLVSHAGASPMRRACRVGAAALAALVGCAQALENIQYTGDLYLNALNGFTTIVNLPTSAQPNPGALTSNSQSGDPFGSVFNDFSEVTSVVNYLNQNNNGGGGAGAGAATGGTGAAAVSGTTKVRVRVEPALKP